jgi:hypothetical protein
MKRILGIAVLVAACGGTVASPHPTASPSLALTPSSDPIQAPIDAAVPELQSVGFGTSFGTGDSSCVLAGVASTFPTGATVAMAASFSRPVPSSVSITSTKDGVDIYDPVTIKPDLLGCINGRLPGLEAGHYKIVFTVPASEMPPLVGEFDVTP